MARASLAIGRADPGYLLEHVTGTLTCAGVIPRPYLRPSTIKANWIAVKGAATP